MPNEPWNQDGYWFNADEADESLTVEKAEEAWKIICNSMPRAEFDAWMWELRNIVETHDAFDGAGF